MRFDISTHCVDAASTAQPLLRAEKTGPAADGFLEGAAQISDIAHRAIHSGARGTSLHGRSA